jgi:regulation of enolase protein 1 (concanavalin A-like superfamily)
MMGISFIVSVSGDFAFAARVNGEYAALYDQAGLMVVASDTEERLD